MTAAVYMCQSLSWVLGYIFLVKFSWKQDPGAIVWGQVTYLGVDRRNTNQRIGLWDQVERNWKGCSTENIAGMGNWSSILLENSGRKYRICLGISHPGWKNVLFILQLPSVTGWHLVSLNWAERKSSGRVAQVLLLKDTGRYWDGERPEIMDKAQPGSAIKPNGKP